MNTCSPFGAYLADRWRTNLFKQRIFPGFPFRPAGWSAIAFNRDNHGNVRLPGRVWERLILEIRERTSESSGFVVAPDFLLSGTVKMKEQPFVVSLDVESAMAHFSDSDKYLPDFFMAGVSERWAIWGDSDLTVLGGAPDLMAAVCSEIGDRPTVLNTMIQDFGLDESKSSDGMRSYLENILNGNDAFKIC